MKTIITLASLAISSFAIAQDNYTIKSAVSVEGLPADQAAFGEMESTTYIKGDKMKMELSSMMYNMTVANDGEKTFMLQEVMGEKSGFYMTKAESEAEEKEAAAKEDKNKPKPKIVVTTDKKMIAGFEATKAFVYNTKKDGKQDTAIVWFTDKIKKPSTKSGRGMGPNLEGLTGFPLETTYKQNQMGMSMTVTNKANEVLTTAIDDKTFAVDTAGYKVTNYKVFKEKMKSAQGGPK
ncbi:MAG: hypothetical protein ACK5QC_04200 [Bacteroidota bacterium]|jgi:hypothetical protein|nr:hypothetical protein [Bacteroidota bacterium]MCA6443274.1 hypothetical protein [Bacteroidota bacterium]